MRLHTHLSRANRTIISKTVQIAIAILMLGLLAHAPSRSAEAANGGTTLRLNSSGEYVSVTNDPAFNPSGAITIEAWVYPNTTTTCGTIVGKSFGSGYWMGLCNNNKLRYYVNGSGTAFDSNWALQADKWSHVAVTYDGSTLKLYIDGMLDRTVGIDSALPVNSFDLGIGADYNGAYRFDGDIAEVRLWDVARSITEIQNDMVRMLDEERDGLVTVWPLRENAEDIFGTFPGIRRGGVALDGRADVPAYPYNPIPIPRLPSTPIVNGGCGLGEYGALKLPIWYSNTHSPFNIQWVSVGATASNIYACINGITLGGGHADHFFAMYLDPNNDGGALADGDDYRVRVDWPDDTSAQHRGNGFGSYTPTTDLNYSAEGDSFEFDWSTEFRISRSEMPASDSQFRLQFMHHNHTSSGVDDGWPVYWDRNTPNAWPIFQVDDNNIPTPDSRPPTVSVRRTPAREVMEGQPVQLIGIASDDVNVARIDIYVDSAIVKTCDITNTTTYAECSHSQTYATGGHSYYAVATDWRGAVRGSELGSFFVEVDGEAPELEVRYLTNNPAVGDSVQIQATATDPSGIDEIQIIGYGSGSHTYSFSGTNRRETCTHSFNFSGTSQLGRFRAHATDDEGLTNLTQWQYVLFNNTGTDSDGDGIVDAIEDTLCTSRWLVDSDGDALSDAWEILGASFADGDYVPLPSLGADPCQKDIFFQMDYETGLQLPQTERDNHVNLFRDNGITLHLTGKEHPAPANSNTCPPAENSPNSSIEAAAQLDEYGEYYFPPKYNYTHYFGMARHHNGRSGAWGHFFTLDACVTDDYIRTLHELGHALGLGHGGREGTHAPIVNGDEVRYDGVWNNQNRKPNYNSVMNYRMWWRSNLCFNPADSSFSARVDLSQRPGVDLRENALDERTSSLFNSWLRARTCDVTGAVPVVIYTCDDPDEGRRFLMASDGTRTVARMRDGSDWQMSGLPTHAAGIDWDCDGSIEASVTSNLNGDGGDNEWTGGSANETLKGVPRDWGRIPTGRTCHSYGDRQPAAYRAAVGGSSCASRSIEMGSGAPIAAYAGASDLYAMRSAKFERLVQAHAMRGGHANHNGHEAHQPHVGKPIEDLYAGLQIELCDGVNNNGNDLIDEGCPDEDADGVIDAIDNCRETANGTQADLDGDHLGDLCQLPALSSFTIPNGGQGAVGLAWSTASADIGGFDIWRRAEFSDTLTFVTRLPGDVRQYVDQLPSRGEDGYIYELRILNLNMEETDALQAGFNAVPTSVTAIDGQVNAAETPTVILLTTLLLTIAGGTLLLKRRSV